MKQLSNSEINALTEHFRGVLTILSNPENEPLDLGIMEFDEMPFPPTNPTPPVSLHELLGEWSYNHQSFTELGIEPNQPFTIFGEYDNYFISFDENRKERYHIEEVDEEEGIFGFFIGSYYIN